MGTKNTVMGLGVAALLLAAWMLSRGPKPPAPGQVPDAAAAGPSDALAADTPGVLPAAVGSRVGFIDLETVYNSCKQTKEFDKEVEKFRQDAGKRLEPLEKELKQLMEQTKQMKPDAPERLALEETLRDKKQEYDRAAEPEWKDLNRRSLKTRERIYTLIRAAAAKVARARGMDLVVADIEEPHADFKGDSADELDRALREYSMKMQRKAVLFGTREADLTSAVLDAVNAEP